MHVARLICVLSVAASVFWVGGFIAESLLQSEPPLFLLAGSSFLVGAVMWWRIYTSGSRFLAGKISRRLLGLYAISTAAAYVLTMPLGAVIGIAYIGLSHGYLPKIEGESSVFVGLATIWLPLWWSPALGLTVGWFVCSRNHAHADGL